MSYSQKKEVLQNLFRGSAIKYSAEPLNTVLPKKGFLEDFEEPFLLYIKNG
jgi:hypothetical protein